MKKNQFVQAQEEQEHVELKKMVRDELEDPRVVARGKMILACLQGRNVDEVAQEFFVSRSMIFRWRARYFQEGVNGLRDKPRCGKPPKYDLEFEKKVLDLLDQQPPDGMVQWDGPTIARQLSASNDAVWRVLRKHHISLARQREWRVAAKLRTPPNFPVISGIYIGPPVWMATILEDGDPTGNAFVVTRERQAGIALHQAAEKSDGVLPLSEAIRLMAGQGPNQAADYTRHMEIISFLNDAAAIPAKGKRAKVYVVGSAAQLGIANWMAAHSQVDMIFHATLEESVAAIRKSLSILPTASPCPFITLAASYPSQANPFIWKKIQNKG